MKYKLICLDIDGTLLNEEKKLLPEVRRAVREAADMGVQIALVSGRLPAGVELIEKQLGVPCIKVCIAGTYVILGSQCINIANLPPRTMLRVYKEIAEKNQVPLWIFREKEWFVTDIDHFIECEIEFVQYQPLIVDAVELAGEWEKEKTGPNKLLIAAEPKKLQVIYEQMKEQALPDIDIACSADNMLEIFPKGVTKGTALMRICETLNINLADTIAVGDQELDIPMLEAAGAGVAMGNGIEEIKQMADFVTKTNNEAGAAYAIWHYLKQ